MANSQPSLASIYAMQRPKPTLAPVTNAVFPLSCRSMVLLPEMPEKALNKAQYAKPWARTRVVINPDMLITVTTDHAPAWRLRTDLGASVSL